MGKLLIPETNYTRKLTFRSDECGLYLLLWEGDNLLAGASYQYYSNLDHQLLPGFKIWSWLRINNEIVS